MNIIKIALLCMLIFGFVACNQSKDNSGGHGHGHEDVTVSYVGYGNGIEVFVDAEPLAFGRTSTLNVHLTQTSDFKPISPSEVTGFLIINDKGLKQIQHPQAQRGIYQFLFQPQNFGLGYMEFAFEWEGEEHLIRVENIKVFEDTHEAIHMAEAGMSQTSGAIPFSKEQSWKVEFKTAMPEIIPFGKVIKTTASISTSPLDQVVVSAKSSGFVKFESTIVSPGKVYKKAQKVFSIHSDGIMANNAEVRLKKAKLELELAKTEYERDKLLAETQIVSQKELIESNGRYQKALTELKNLKKSLDKNGERILAPLDGFIAEVMVENGQYVEAGEALFSMHFNRRLLLKALISQKHFNDIREVEGINVKINESVLSLMDLNGKLLSVGKAISSNHHLFPISFELDHHDALMNGGFASVFIKCRGKEQLVIPERALTEEQGVFFVYVQITPELFEKRQVKIGAGDGINRVVVSGLGEKERLVVEGGILVKLAAVSNTIDPHAGHVH